MTTYYDMGVYIQVNADSITGGAGRKIKKIIGALLDEELIYSVGTDAHDKKHRSPKMKKAAAYVREKVRGRYMRQIFYENAKEMVKRRGNRHHMEKKHKGTDMTIGIHKKQKQIQGGKIPSYLFFLQHNLLRIITHML